MIDLKFIQFYVKSIYDKSIEEYFHVEKSTVSNWRKRGMPKRYLSVFIDIEKSDDIYELFHRIYPKINKNEMTQKQKLAISILTEISINGTISETFNECKDQIDKGIFTDVKKRLEDSNLIGGRHPNSKYFLSKEGDDVVKNNPLISNYI